MKRPKEAHMQHPETILLSRGTQKLTRSIPLHDYGPALQSAVSWLGDRYVLAEPVPRRSEDRKPFFNSPRVNSSIVLGP